MNAATENVMTVYGLLARRHNTTEDYVGQVVRGDRKARWGKGLSILRDFNILQSSLDDWFCHIQADESMRIEMPRNVTVYVQHGVASVYKGSDLLTENDVSKMNVEEFRAYLNDVRIEFN